MTSIYLKLKNSLADDISQGKYQPGDVLPSESDLINTWSVSRITVRSAIKQLAHEGLVYTIQGRGTYVAEVKITNYLPGLTSLSKDVQKKGLTPHSKVLKFEHVSANNEVAARLHLTPGDPVIHFIRVTTADGIPVSIGYTYVSIAAVAPHQDKITANELEMGSFYSLLDRIGVNLVGGVQTISAIAANEFESKFLKIDNGTPLIESLRVAYSSSKLNVEFTRMMARPDMIQWKVILGPVSKEE